MFIEIQECPKCGGCVGADDFATEALVTSLVAHLHCAFCGLVIERLFRIEGGTLKRDFDIEHYSARDAADYDKHLKRLHELRAA